MLAAYNSWKHLISDTKGFNCSEILPEVQWCFKAKEIRETGIKRMELSQALLIVCFVFDSPFSEITTSFGRFLWICLSYFLQAQTGFYYLQREERLSNYYFSTWIRVHKIVNMQNFWQKSCNLNYWIYSFKPSEGLMFIQSGLSKRVLQSSK